MVIMEGSGSSRSCVLVGHGGLVEMCGSARKEVLGGCLMRNQWLELHGSLLTVWKSEECAKRYIRLQTPAVDGDLHDMGKKLVGKMPKAVFRERVLHAEIRSDMSRCVIQVVSSSGKKLEVFFDEKNECQQWLDALQTASTYRFSEHYELGPLLGSGSFAEVRLCRDKLTGAALAAKRIKSNRGTEPDEFQLREVCIGLTMHHQNIVEVRDVFVESRAVYLVQEYVAGGTLRDIVAEKLSEPVIRVIIKQILLGVRYLHRKKVIHRDLKLANVLISVPNLTSLSVSEISSMSDLIKIGDLGLSQCCSMLGSGSGEVFHTVVGSPRYIAPELLAGNGYSFSADMWSVGVILFALLSGGKYPVLGENKKDILGRLADQKIERMEGPDWEFVSESAKDMVSNLLVFNPQDRISAEGALEHRWMTDESIM
mmetsp:Transcript_19200/g.19336  ORF Transcript_19200/g.19336 Transcript_19200/m.19336 type:complete len:426 (-) Transcript_19200:67-1344(-)